ncbi:MAG: FecR domain-containing protein [Aeoliella sp.]
MNEKAQRENQQGAAKGLDTLLTGLAQNDLSEADISRLCKLLTESEEARWAYIHEVHLREGIIRWSRTQREADVWAVVDLLRQSDDSQDKELAAELEHQAIDDALLRREAVAGQQTAVQQTGYQQTGASGGRDDTLAPVWLGDGWLGNGRSRRRWAGSVIGAIAASLLVALFWQGSPQQGDAPISNEEKLAVNPVPANKTAYGLADSENVVARGTSATGDVSWSRGQAPQDFLMRLRPGDVVGIEKGLIQLEFSDGALLVVESPAALQVTGATSARLMQGRVVGRADNGNFTLLTPTANVVDIGTEFGVGVSSGGTDVTVFEGEVHVYPPLGSIDTGSVQKLQQGMSVRIDSQGLSNSSPQPNQQYFQRSFGGPDGSSLEENSLSLLDLVSGHKTTHQRIAGSIDPQTGYWGRPPWVDPQRTAAQRGDTQFAQTDWNPMVDGVFIPRANAREMQIDSDGHMVYLPPNNGSTWGPIWARRRFNLEYEQALLSADRPGYWGDGALSQVLERLQQTNDGLMGLHANVGITFDLKAVRESRYREPTYFKAVVATLDSSPAGHSPSGDSSDAVSVADLRVFVDGKLRYSRLQFGRGDGDADIIVALSNEDRFLTIVTTDAGADPVFDHVVLIDPVLEYVPLPMPQPDRT